MAAATRAGGSTTAAAAAHHRGFSFWPACFTTVNYIVGAGFLGLPFVAVKAGLILTPLVVIVFGFVMDFTKDLVVEVLGRAEAIAKATHVAERALREHAQRPATTVTDALIRPRQEDYLLNSTRKFEVTDLLLLFVGRKVQLLYMVLLSLYMAGGLIGYTTIASASLSANVPVSFLGGTTCDIQKDGASCNGPFLFWLCLYAAIVIPVSCLELKEQLWMQVAMFLARIVIMVLLATTTVAGHSCDGVVFADVAPDTEGAGVPLANAGGLGLLIPTAIFAFIFHHSIPALSQPVADKRSLRAIFRAAFVIVGVCYVAIGIAVAAFLGTAVDGQCSLNWRNYVGCMPRPAGYQGAPAPLLLGGTSLLPAAASCANASGWGAECVDVSARPLWATLVSVVVLVFPALDVLSAFPLNALTLGNNLMSAALGEAALAPPTRAEEAAFWAGPAEGRRGGGGPCACLLRALFVGRRPPPLEAAAESAADADAEAADALLLTSSVGGSKRSSGDAAAAVVPAKSSAEEGTPLLDDSDGEGGGEGGGEGDFTEEADLLLGLTAGGGGAAPAARPLCLRTRRGHRVTTVLFRLLAAVPPVVVAAAFHNLSSILALTGMVGIAIAFTVPCVLSLFAFAKERAVFTAISHAVLPLLLAAQRDHHAALREGDSGSGGSGAQAAAAGAAGSVNNAGDTEGASSGSSGLDAVGAALALGSAQLPAVEAALARVRASREGAIEGDASPLPAAAASSPAGHPHQQHQQQLRRRASSAPESPPPAAGGGGQAAAAGDAAALRRGPPSSRIPVHALHALCTEVAHATQVHAREAFTRTPLDPSFAATPYTPFLSSARWHIVEALLVVSGGLFVFVAVAIVQSIL